MKRFSQLYLSLDNTNRTLDKVAALVEYFSRADVSASDAAWAVYFLIGNRPKQAVPSRRLKTIAAELAGLSEWLFAECYDQVGDLAETIANVLPPAKNTSDMTLSAWVTTRVLTLRALDEATQQQTLIEYWDQLSTHERFIFNKLITGGFRVGVSQSLVVRALSQVAKVDAKIITHRLAGDWQPSAAAYEQLIATTVDAFDPSQPYPFFLAHPLQVEPATLGDASEWQAEWKWDGIRGQIIKRNNELFVWSRGEELMTDKFPEYKILQEVLPNGTAIDGEIISLATTPTEANFAPLPFAALQTRIGRKNITAKQLKEAPVGFIAYDLIEENGVDIRNTALTERRKKLEKVISKINLPFVHVSPIIDFTNWNELVEIRKQSRDKGSEGIMLKRKQSEYKDGRKRGDWWKWKIDPLTIDAVLIYAQKGSGRRSNLYTDYTFAVKDGDKLVTFAKAYSGLTDKEFAQVDSFVKRNAIEKFGPVRTVKPELVFELAFEGIAQSNRHKSGVALRFPRMLRWRKDKTVADINTLEDLKMMLKIFNEQYEGGTSINT